VTEAVLAVLPVLSPAALAAPAGRPLLLQALDVLADGGLSGRAVVTVAPELLDGVRALDPPGDVLPAGGGLLSALRAALATRPGAGVLLLLDPLQVHTPPPLVAAVLEALRGAAGGSGSGPNAEPVSVPPGGRPDAVVPVRPVTDTLKRVGADGAVSGTEDRDGYRWALTPQACRRAPLVAALAAAGEDGDDGDGPQWLPRLLARHGARVATLAAAVDVLRADDADGLALAAAVHG
jgi:2-C-methyl-D-erythritol 4-phosphate cytidylyltransferase